MGLVGRDAETGDVVARLRDRRLVTITGPGGIGKTALAHAAAAVVGPEFTYGAITVDLTRIDQPAGVFEAIAGQLGYADFDSLMNSPSDQPALIVVDNCEHVLDAAADSIAQMLAACHMPTILATSRSPLDLPEESVLALGPLPIPPAESDDGDVASVQMLLERAHHHGVRLGSDDLAGVAEACRRLDGVPLAIELAAARLRTASLTELLAELDARPHSLARRRFRGQPRHRSVGDLVAWSLDLLTAEHHRFFVRLGVFAGPFTAPLAHAVAGDAPTDEMSSRELLDDLANASLVTIDTSGEVAWYRLLHPVRAVALDRLARSGDLDATRSRFVDQVVTLALDVIRRATGGWGADVLGDLMALYGNISASLRWTLERDADSERSLTLLAVLWGVVHQAHTAEIGAIGEEVLERWPDPAAALWPDAAATVATCRYLLGDLDGAISLADAALEHADTSAFAPATLRRVYAQALRAKRRFEESAAMFAEAAEAGEDRDAHGLAMELWVDHALVVAELGDVDGAAKIIERVIEESIEREAPINHAWAAAALGVVVFRRDPAAAMPLIEEALAEARSIGYPAGCLFGLRSLATARLEAGDLGGAARALLEIVDGLLQQGGLNDLRMALDLAAMVLERRGDDRWADLARTAEALPVTTVSEPVESELFERANGLGTVLSIRDAYTLCRRSLGDVVTATDRSCSPSPVGPTSESPVGSHAAMVLEGEVWRVTFARETVRLKRSKGLDDLARLLEAPGREMSCLDLMGSSIVATRHEDELIDVRARREYEQRVRELQVDLEEAHADHDIGRAERLQVELDSIVDQLTAVLGLGGRTRTTTSETERARSAVTQRIRSTIRRIDGHHPALAAHLRASIHTGIFCRYEPETDQGWTIER